MTKRRARQLLWTTAATAAVVAFLAIGLAISLPVNLPANDAAAAAIPSADNNPASDAIPSQSDLDKISSLDLGHDLVASPAPPSAGAAPPQSSAPDLHLIGTIIEPGHCLAMLAGPAEKTIFLGIGDQFQDAKITAISIDSITVEIAGKPTILKVEKPPVPATNLKPITVTVPEDQ